MPMATTFVGGRFFLPVFDLRTRAGSNAGAIKRA
jgi:hypothetical protein